MASEFQVPVAEFSPRDAFYKRSVRRPLKSAVGHASAELLCPYPPGVPLVFPGELITANAVRLLQDTVAEGGVVTGASDGTLETILVLSGGD